ncbi:luciferase-like protein [Mycobacterium sp. MOTT36Y]|nr:luciferase-like protein [Mycobacterium sp. MOTT36Y]
MSLCGGHFSAGRGRALMFTLRFDMRAPGFGAPPADLYAAVVDMCAWAETPLCGGIAPDVAWPYLERAAAAAAQAHDSAGPRE